jgi:hypothetical protein
MRRIVRRGAPGALAWSAAWLFSAALYLLLIDTMSLPELVVGAVVATLAATGFELAREQRVAKERIRPRWLLNGYRALVKVPNDIVLVTIAAFRQLGRRERQVGRFRAVEFDTRGSGELSDGRAALSESLGSFAPNTIIVGIDRTRGLILGHQLRRTGGAEAIDVLELGER